MSLPALLYFGGRKSGIKGLVLIDSMHVSNALVVANPATSGKIAQSWLLSGRCTYPYNLAIMLTKINGYKPAPLCEE